MMRIVNYKPIDGSTGLSNEGNGELSEFDGRLEKNLIETAEVEVTTY